MPKPTLQDIANASQVSIATVSLALSGKGRMTAEIRQRVLSIAEELGYRKAKPSIPEIRGLPIIGILFQTDTEWSFAYRFNTPLINEIERYFFDRRYQVVIIPVTVAMGADDIFRRIENLNCRGIFAVYFGNESLFTRLEKQDIGLVLLMNSNYQNRFSSVSVDDYQCAYEGALHLLQSGHRHLIFIDIERSGLPMISLDRFIGFKKAIEEFDIPLSDIERLTYDRNDHEYLRNRLSVIFGSANHPTAIFALDDDIAARSITILAEMGIKVPRDVSVIAPGDLLDYDLETTPRITTMHIDTGLMGSIACGLMENRIKHYRTGINVLKVKQQMVSRGSIRPFDKGLQHIHQKKPSQLLPRERALAAFNHIDTGTVPKWIGVSPEFWEKARQTTGFSDDDLNRRLGNDFRRVESQLGGWGSRWRSPFGHDRRVPGYGQPVRKPLLDSRLPSALRNFPWPNPGLADISHIKAEAQLFHQEFAVLGGEWSPFWHDAIDFVGTQDLYYLMYDDPDFILRLLDQIVDYYVAATTVIFETAGKFIDIFFIGNDFGGQNGPLLSVEQFERFIVPSLKRLTELGHRYGKKVMLHSAGGIRPLIPAIVRSGVDAIHALQPDCAGMSPAGIKKSFGSQICLSGGIDAMNLLLSGNPESVRLETLQVLETMAPGGAYIASPSHEAILADTPVENVLALFDAVREYELKST